ncbi:MAG: glycosyltransferase family 39 protein [Flavobacteriales bacterium]|nr:glycosyltransferase family 39 protein [Flavobacteriales bacterium]
MDSVLNLHHLSFIYSCTNTTPWLDEGQLLGTTQSYANTGKFHPDIAPYCDIANNYNIFDPIYFWFTNFFTNTFGYGIFQFRITTLIFSIASLLVFRKIISVKPDQNWANLFGILFMFDPIFQNNMHEARMDSMAIFFLGSSLLASIYFLKKEHKYLLFLSATLGVSALLTSPRSTFVLLFVALPILKSGIKNIVLWSAPILTLYSIWIF